MKKKQMLLCAAAALVSLQACDNDDNESQYVSAQTKQAFSAKYPDAKRVEWEVKNKYVVADFTNDSREVSAWFDNNGTWYMTETDMPFNQLPEGVKTSFSSGLHSSWRVEDVDKIERQATETIYVVEVEKQQSEVDLYYSTQGVLVKTMTDADGDYDYEDFIPAVLPAAIEDYLKANYPNAQVVEVDKDNRQTEVEIVDGLVKRDLIFDSKDVWVSTQTEVRVGDVPAEIASVLSKSEYSQYRIDDVDFYQTPLSEYYRFELELGSVEVTVEITTDGVLTVVGVRP